MERPLYLKGVTLASYAAISTKFQAMRFRIPIRAQILAALPCVLRWL